MGTDKDITDLQELVSAMMELIFQGQNEIRALERVLVERHGLSLEVLSEYRAAETAKATALRAAAADTASAIQQLKRFHRPPQ